MKLGDILSIGILYTLGVFKKIFEQIIDKE